MTTIYHTINIINSTVLCLASAYTLWNMWKIRRWAKGEVNPRLVGTVAKNGGTVMYESLPEGTNLYTQQG